MLKLTFIDLIKNYSKDTNFIDSLWIEIEKHYSNNKRHYHNLQHLENLLHQLLNLKEEIKDWDIMLFSLFYHDIIYHVLKKDNEEKSADFAKVKLVLLGLSKDRVSNCYLQILATKGHSISKDNDTNIFTDADLSILGFEKSKYVTYYNQVRKEYKMFPNFIYNPNRKKVLQSFINMDRIFKTDYFFNKFEVQARQNIIEEIKIL